MTRQLAARLGALHSPFLAAQPAARRRRILALATQAAPVLDDWAARFPSIRRARVWPLALSVAAAAPFASVADVVATASLSLWVFTLDDLFDEEALTRDALFRAAARFESLSHGEAIAVGEDSLAIALAEVRAGLAAYPLFAAIGYEWARALCGTIRGMKQEYLWRERRRANPASPSSGPGCDSALPSYDEYVENGLYSIGGPPHVWAALITAGDPSTPAHLPHLHHLARLACITVRLANDLQSYAKEVAEDNVNSLVILEAGFRAQGDSAEEARSAAEAQVRTHISACLRELSAARACPRTASGRPEAAIADIAHFVAEFYAAHDYHTFILEGEKPDGPGTAAREKRGERKATGGED